MSRAVTGATIALLAAGSLGPAPAAAAPTASSEPVPADTQVSFQFGLKRDDAGAEAALRRLSDPSSQQYRQFPSRQEIVQQYGARANTVSRVSALFKRFELKPELDPSGVFLNVTGTAAQWHRMLGTRLTQQPGPLQNAGRVWARLPASSVDGRGGRQLLRLAEAGVVPEPVLQDISYEYDTLQLSGILPAGYATAPEAKPLNEGTPQHCPEAGPDYTGEPMYGYNQLRTVYGVDALPTDVGSSVRMVVMSTGTGYSDSSLELSQQCYSLPDVTFTRVTMPELTGPLPEGGEGDLDVQTVQSVLPAGSQVTVLEYGGNQNSFLHWSALFGLPEQPDVATKSSGGCEKDRQEPQQQPTLAIEESVLLRVALSGTTVFNSAGDAGSSGCFDFDNQTGPTGVAADYPGTSRYVVSVGGTYLRVTPDNTRAEETVWNTTQNPQQGTGKSGGGGGHSILFRRPWWQPAADVDSPRRTVPDLSALGAGNPGWPTAQGGAFSANGGTSASSPFVAAAFAVVAGQERAAGRPPLGLVQPWLYQLRKEKSAAFFDVVTESNDLFDVGCCDARTGFDAASGLGAPDFGVIAANVPPPGAGSPSPTQGATP